MKKVVIAGGLLGRALATSFAQDAPNLQMLRYSSAPSWVFDQKQDKCKHLGSNKKSGATAPLKRKAQRKARRINRRKK